MLKRTIFLLSLAGGLFFGLPLTQQLHASPMASAVVSNLPDYLVEDVLEAAAPALGMSLSEAIAAYDNGELSIQVMTSVAGGTIYQVQSAAGDIIDILSIADEL